VKKSTKDPKKVVVLGLYRSGSSATAHLLCEMGVSMGISLYKDHYECEVTSARLRSWWWEPRFVDTSSPAERRAYFKNFLKIAIKCKCNVIGLKHPLLALCIEDLVRSWGNDTKFIWSYRPLEESILSLNRASWPGWPKDSENIQVEIWNKLHEFLLPRTHLKVNCSDLNSNPFETANNIAEFLEMDFPRERLDQIANSIIRQPS